MRIPFGLFFVFLSTFCHAQNLPAPITNDPDSAVIVYKDIINFWKAFDRSSQEGSQAFEKYYIRPGSNGVKHFIDHNRIVNADSLFGTVQKKRSEYLRVREQTLSIEKVVPQCKAVYYSFEYLYPKAKFPPLYFVIGRFNTGGVSLKAEQIIGAEMNELSNIPYLVAHELVHANQNIPYKYKILLEQCIIEGSADFLGELISGKVASQEPYRYAEGREASLKKDFLRDMELGENDDFANWLNAGKRKDDRPADMGYYIGYAITKAYYEKASDKKKAVYDILNIQDCKEFLKKSGYQPDK
ncbi:DUF2268 domain-containing putative Zn-dependent protease [Rufibacter hautae]|uniref:DUF2268 domain-containing protein n=1 Tax=Rufibacter hautae TaxID=2595005 RepID=A0A5B6TKU7_9BACT|nr:DUF2268 domain-containing putative Zn-dependent protease [Rufibacter hautae]KAA3440017.1 hypothetical protein FOA19_04940 [Rufibacter hautae]